MATCKQCREFEKCKDDAFINGAKFDPNESAKYCTGFEPITNADRIRAMSDEELRDFLFNKVSDGSMCSFCVPKMRTEHKCSGHCKNGILEWLKQPAEES